MVDAYSCEQREKLRIKRKHNSSITATLNKISKLQLTQCQELTLVCQVLDTHLFIDRPDRSVLRVCDGTCCSLYSWVNRGASHWSELQQNFYFKPDSPCVDILVKHLDGVPPSAQVKSYYKIVGLKIERQFEVTLKPTFIFTLDLISGTLIPVRSACTSAKCITKRKTERAFSSLLQKHLQEIEQKSPLLGNVHTATRSLRGKRRYLSCTMPSAVTRGENVAGKTSQGAELRSAEDTMDREMRDLTMPQSTTFRLFRGDTDSREKGAHPIKQHISVKSAEDMNDPDLYTSRCRVLMGNRLTAKKLLEEIEAIREEESAINLQPVMSEDVHLLPVEEGGSDVTYSQFFRAVESKSLAGRTSTQDSLTRFSQVRPVSPGEVLSGSFVNSNRVVTLDGQTTGAVTDKCITRALLDSRLANKKPRVLLEPYIFSPDTLYSTSSFSQATVQQTDNAFLGSQTIKERIHNSSAEAKRQINKSHTYTLIDTKKDDKDFESAEPERELLSGLNRPAKRRAPNYPYQITSDEGGIKCLPPTLSVLEERPVSVTNCNAMSTPIRHDRSTREGVTQFETKKVLVASPEQENYLHCQSSPPSQSILTKSPCVTKFNDTAMDEETSPTTQCSRTTKTAGNSAKNFSYITGESCNRSATYTISPSSGQKSLKRSINGYSGFGSTELSDSKHFQEEGENIVSIQNVETFKTNYFKKGKFSISKGNYIKNKSRLSQTNETGSNHVSVRLTRQMRAMQELEKRKPKFKENTCELFDYLKLKSKRHFPRVVLSPLPVKFQELYYASEAEFATTNKESHCSSRDKNQLEKQVQDPASKSDKHGCNGNSNGENWSKPVPALSTCTVKKGTTELVHKEVTYPFSPLERPESSKTQKYDGAVNRCEAKRIPAELLGSEIIPNAKWSLPTTFSVLQPPLVKILAYFEKISPPLLEGREDEVVECCCQTCHRWYRLNSVSWMICDSEQTIPGRRVPVCSDKSCVGASMVNPRFNFLILLTSGINKLEAHLKSQDAEAFFGCSADEFMASADVRKRVRNAVEWLLSTDKSGNPKPNERRRRFTFTVTTNSFLQRGCFYIVNSAIKYPQLL